MKITIYDKYIFKQVAITTFVAILLFTVVWIAPEMLLNTIKKILAGEYTLKMGVAYLTYQLPLILGKAFPVGLLLGSLFTFDKLSKDSELTIFRAVGLSFKRIVTPVMFLSLIVTILCFVTYDKLIPYSQQALLKMQCGNPVSQYIYTEKDSQDRPVKAVIVSRYDNYVMDNVIVLDFSKKIYDDVHGIAQIYVAEQGFREPNKWVLKDILVYNITQEGIYKQIAHKDTMDIMQGPIAEDISFLMEYSNKKDREITNANLKHYVDLLKEQKMEEPYRLMLNKYYQRFFHPFVCILLAAMGCLLGFSKPREQRLIGFTIAIGAIFLYYITLPFFDLLAEKGVILPIIAAAFPPVTFLLACIAFYKSKDI